MVLIGAVHECLAAFDAILASPECEFAGVVTLTPEAGAKVSGTVDIASRASEHQIPVVLVEDVNAPQSVAAIRALAPDLVAVVGWTRLIHDELLELPTHGCIGFHASLLPHNRGRAPVNWAIIRGERETGNTMMLLNSGVDTGGVVDQRSTPIDPEDTCATVYERVAALGASMLTDNLGPLLRGEVVPRRQDESRANLLPKRVPLMGVTDWRRSAQEIHDWIRAQTDPYPGAFTHLEGERLTLWRSTPPGSSDSPAAPGTVVAVDRTGLTVATGSGTILITEVGTSVHPHLHAHEWAARAGLSVGARLDQPSDAWVAWSLGHGPRPEETR
ncbi:methionyl-tRNA formyltransferase [Nocardioides daphniae]|uniref:methionyl-tRNA formyltransferase n=1 Tax=Nocardioides daphniae TaxID=402297 RepID=UPI0013151705|nr:methionyl-tRNA formyltransferase [Nocardioides daphniae]